MRVDLHRSYDLVLAARMDEANEHVLDRYLLPRSGLQKATVILGTATSPYSAFRVLSLKPLVFLCALKAAGEPLPSIDRFGTLVSSA